MTRILKCKFPVLLLFLFSIISCKKEAVIIEENCSVRAFYKGVNVCFNDGNAAAVELDNSAKHVIIFSNFFELTNLETLELDTELYVDFPPIPEEDFIPSGLLCGAAIVAPITTLDCLTVPE